MEGRQEDENCMKGRRAERERDELKKEELKIMESNSKNEE
jgi:hypothetical protein